MACIEWIEHLMSGGNWMPGLVAGGASLFGQTGKHSPWLDWDDFRAADPSLASPSSAALDATPVRMQRALIDEVD